jgi:hypothetical protein
MGVERVVWFHLQEWIGQYQQQKGLNYMSEKTITISQDEYDQLRSDSEFLECLHSAGVDNWDGYDVAQDMMDELEEDDEK